MANKKIDKRFGKAHTDSIVGEQFNRWTVISRAKNDAHTRLARWICQCECGSIKAVYGRALKKGNSQSCGCLQKLEDQRAAKNRLYKRYIYSAQQRGVSFYLSLAEFEILTQQSCYYCGKPPEQILRRGKSIKTGGYIYNGIDRVDNSQGYLVDNCVAACGQCNKMKSKYSQEDFLKRIKLIASRHCL